MFHARYSDAVVLGGTRNRDFLPIGLIETLLVGCGRPVILALEIPPRNMIGTIVVGWGTREYDELRHRASKGQHTFLDAYGGTNPGEFFAVITEYFFDKPLQMKRHHPELYSLLHGFYRQDPAVREARHAHRHPGSGNADH
jgi:hypothetical protein